jgi:ribonuclease VapC
VLPTVLDASALLAYMRREPGADEVRKALHQGCLISTINFAEVLSKTAERGADPNETASQLFDLGWALKIIPPDDEDAVRIAHLRAETKKAGLSLADRACLALAQRDDLPVLTADHDWEHLALKPRVAVTCIR